MLEPVVRRASRARWASRGVAQREALADLDVDDAAAQRVEQTVGDRAHLGRRARVVAEIRARDARRFADEGRDVHRLDRAGGLAVADEMAAHGQRLVGAQEGVAADGVVDHVAAAPRP